MRTPPPERSHDWPCMAAPGTMQQLQPPGIAMSRIDIHHAHSLSKPKARKAVEDMAKKLAERFQMVYSWEGDTLNFSRSGVDGHIELGPKELRVHAKLGFLAAMFKDSIQNEIMKVLAEKF